MTLLINNNNLHPKKKKTYNESKFSIKSVLYPA